MIQIRPIRVSDAHAFREVLDAVCRERRYLATFEAPALEDTRKFVASNVRNKIPQFVAEADGKVVGWCDVIPGKAGRSHVGTLGMGVHRNYRSRRIGVGLLETTLAEARRIGLEKIELSAHASNLVAIALYRKLGFIDEGVRRRGWLVDGIHEDLVLMALDLRAPAIPETTGA
jgi:ribosomal protein S18 acetylase RimI-like enzyme